LFRRERWIWLAIVGLVPNVAILGIVAFAIVAAQFN
jgi:hypothetical protein